MSRPNKVKLMSSDGDIFEVDELVAYESQFLKMMIEDIVPDEAIPLPEVSSTILSKVIAFCKYHVESQKTSDEELPVPMESQNSSDEGLPVPVESQKNSDEEFPVPQDTVKQWEAEFVKVDQSTLYGLINAANYLNIKHLLELTCQTVADMIKNKSPQELRDFLHTKIEFTREEEEESE